jgi:hypothetical protein
MTEFLSLTLYPSNFTPDKAILTHQNRITFPKNRRFLHPPLAHTAKWLYYSGFGAQPKQGSRAKIVFRNHLHHKPMLNQEKRQ